MNPYDVGDLEPHEPLSKESQAPAIPKREMFILIGCLCWMVFWFVVFPILVFVLMSMVVHI